MAITFDTSELDSLVVTFSDFEVNLEGLESQTEQVISEAISEQFSKVGNRSGDKWAEKKIPDGKDILVDSGKLKDQLSKPKTEINKFTINVKFSGDHVFLGAIHNQGTDKAGKNHNIVIPKRIIFKLIRVDIDRLGTLVINKITDNFAQRLKQRRKR